MARAARNVPTAEVIRSVELATTVCGPEAILVIGHNGCGAINSAIDWAVVGDNLTTLLHEIALAVEPTSLTGARTSKNTTFVLAVNQTNVRMGVATPPKKSAVLKAVLDAGQPKIVYGLFDLKSRGVSQLISIRRVSRLHTLPPNFSVKPLTQP